MPNVSWHDYLVFISFLACIAGLFLLFNPDKTQVEKMSCDEQMLLEMSFTYWIIYCITVGMQKLELSHWEILLLSLKLTAVISYLLTFSCVLTLPLHRLASRYIEDWGVDWDRRGIVLWRDISRLYLDFIALAIASSNSSLLTLVMMNTSWKVLPDLAIILNPPRIGTDTFNCKRGEWPLALPMTAGVMVWIPV